MLSGCGTKESRNRKSRAFFIVGLFFIRDSPGLFGRSGNAAAPMLPAPAFHEYYSVGHQQGLYASGIPSLFERRIAGLAARKTAEDIPDQPLPEAPRGGAAQVRARRPQSRPRRRSRVARGCTCPQLTCLIVRRCESKAGQSCHSWTVRCTAARRA